MSDHTQPARYAALFTPPTVKDFDSARAYAAAGNELLREKGLMRDGDSNNVWLDVVQRDDKSHVRLNGDECSRHLTAASVFGISSLCIPKRPQAPAPQTAKVPVAENV